MPIPEKLRIPVLVFSIQAGMLAALGLIYFVLVPR